MTDFRTTLSGLEISRFHRNFVPFPFKVVSGTMVPDIFRPLCVTLLNLCRG